ncbi:glycosyltransferase family 20 protein [Aplosporella prunicola CBS 121167]|uniref:Glycosyltransferase family 20 protein n=1 Tax=Aplosporella prunicola CBS 121167 TaxID=1176127 RepID=A0A6A6BDR0_9PEZI|nr:glycosyltransferase family 20 protein [Aplosporella prunicola CBS 121167]KAF2142196.1 glycosyltransferase family 20 protein [Aplosporella prunicola CBS 121167]
MPTFIVSLFLPYTIDFHDLPQSSPPSRRPSPPRRNASKLEPAAEPGEQHASLFAQPTPPQTPSATAAHEEFFTQEQPSVSTHFPKPHDPRSLVRSDAHVPEWGSGLFFNQPRSRAAAPPSEDILKYTKAQELAAAAHHQRRPSRRSPKRMSVSSNRSSSSSRQQWGSEWTVEPAVQGNGGLANAVRAAIGAGKLQDVYWVGTVGFPTDALDDGKKHEIHEKLESEFDALTVFVNDNDFDGHYTHYCKTILWPVFHYQIPDHPKSKAYEDHSWIYYVHLNQAFADNIIKSYKRGDVIWVHDYHLLLVPGMVRKKLPDAEIGFFMHTAFPSSEVFRCLAVRRELLEGMLGANLVAFQSREYAQHFLQTCSRLLIVEATNDGVQLENRFVNVAWLPIGIDPKSLALVREEPTVKEWIKVMQERYKGKMLIVARDKLDQVRGVRQKLLSFELFLNKYPQFRDKVVMIQVATSTTENSELAMTVSDIVTRIESTHSTLAHQPLVFLRQDIAFSQYLALLSVADVLMITSLREGMNLTAHEFIACQDGRATEKKHGPLILSEFTGSTSIFGGNELAVNPWDYKQCAEAIKTALEMSPEEKERRYTKLNNVIMHHTGEYWCTTLSHTLAKVHEEHFMRDTMSIPRLSTSQLCEKYKNANRRIFILDYEGTLASYGSPTSIIMTSPQRVIDALNEVLMDNKNMVYVMSGRTPEELERLFSRVPTLGLIAENGCFVRPFGTDQWVAFADTSKVDEWKASVKEILQYYKDRVEGSWVEERHCSLIFHYEQAEDFDAAATQAGECATHINEVCAAQHVHAVPIDKCILVEPLDWSKGSAATHIFKKYRDRVVEKEGDSPAEFLLVAGDDREDEPIFRWANQLGKTGVIRDVTTVSVGTRNTEANATLTQGTTGLLSVLQKLAKLSENE